MGDYRTTRPEEIWKKIRDGEITEPTAGMCGGYAQANLVILPKKYAEDFKKFAERNPKPCPILEIMDGSPLVHDMGEGANIRRCCSGSKKSGPGPSWGRGRMSNVNRLWRSR